MYMLGKLCAEPEILHGTWSSSWKAYCSIILLLTLLPLVKLTLSILTIHSNAGHTNIHYNAGAG